MTRRTYPGSRAEVGAGKGGEAGVWKCGGPAPSLGTALAATATSAAAVGEPRGCAGERRSFFAER